jgi:hypothetical protein
MQSSQRLSKQTRTGISKKKEPNKTYWQQTGGIEES